jgi:hypothetical protein
MNERSQLITAYNTWLLGAETKIMREPQQIKKIHLLDSCKDLAVNLYSIRDPFIIKNTIISHTALIAHTQTDSNYFALMAAVKSIFKKKVYEPIV